MVTGGTITTETAALPLDPGVGLVYTKATWGGSWSLDPSIEPVNASYLFGGHNTGSATLRRRFGSQKDVYENDLGARPELNLDDYWVRIDITNDQSDYATSWVGRVASEARQIFGTGVQVGGTTVNSGVQHWICHGAAWVLNRIPVSRAYVRETLDETERTQEVGWIPIVNRRDKIGRLVGNRTEAKVGGSYMFGGTSVWTYHDFIEYVLDHFADLSDDGGPEFKLTGQADILKEISVPLELGTTQSVLDILRRMINPTVGLDFLVVYNGTDFEIDVRSLAVDNITAGGYTLPKNPLTVTIEATEALDMEISMHRSREHAYSRVRGVGARILMCGSLLGETKGDDSTRDDNEFHHEGDWTSELEDEYKTGDPNLVGASQAWDRANDLWRASSERLRPVYQRLHAKATWNPTPPALAADGTVEEAGTPGDEQRAIRSTQAWLPLREDYDYSVDPAVDINATGSDGPQRQITAYVWDEVLQASVDGGYVNAAHIGIEVEPLQDDLGAHLTPPGTNHLLGLNSFDATNYIYGPKYDYKKSVLTLAWRADQRLVVEYELPDSVAGGEIKEIDFGHAELWYMLPETVVDVGGIQDEYGETDTSQVGKLVTSGTEPRVLRTDAPEIGVTLAGWIVRYINARNSGHIMIRRIVPWHELVGRIATVLDVGGTSNQMRAPFTSVSWDFDAGTTTIMAGYAG